jgi:bacillithiol synthase
MRFLQWMERPPDAPERPEESPLLPSLGLPSGPALPWRALIELASKRLSKRQEFLPPEVQMAILDWNLRLGADPELREPWHEIMRGRGLVVITGQQPGLLGGPLYSLYKLLTAVSLARRLERELSAPVLAIFWIVGDDADFGEVSSTCWPQSDGRVVKLRDPDLPPAGTLVGSLPAGRQRAILEADPSLLAGAGAIRLAPLMRQCLEDGRTWSEVQAGLFFRLLPRLPFLALDGGGIALTRLQSAWLAWAASEWPIHALLEEGAAEARAIGFEPALDPQLGQRTLFRLSGDRRAPMTDRPESGELLAPNVVLRPVLQDHLLPNVATICGPSEIRYRAQLGPIYRQAGVSEPVRLPRLSGVLIPAWQSDLSVALTRDRSAAGQRSARADETDPMQAIYLEAAVEPEGFLDRLVKRFAPGSLLEMTDAARAKMRSVLEEVRGPLTAYDPGLAQILDSGAGKIDYQMARIEDGVRAKARHRLFLREPSLAHWKDFLRPRDGEQERSLSLLTPFLSEGEQVGPVLLEAAGAHLARTLERGVRSARALFLLDHWGPGARDEASEG